MNRPVLLVAVGLLVGCSADQAASGAADASADPATRFPYAGEDCPNGVRPSLSECSFVARFHAECGGEGSPRLACSGEGGDCRWYVGGCVAQEAVAVSRCSADDICCEEDAPFLSDAFDKDFPDWIYDMEGLGRLPWDRDRGMTLSISEVESVPRRTSPVKVAAPSANQAPAMASSVQGPKPSTRTSFPSSLEPPPWEAGHPASRSTRSAASRASASTP